MLFSFHGSLLLEAAFIYYHKKIILSTTIFIFFKIFLNQHFDLLPTTLTVYHYHSILSRVIFDFFKIFFIQILKHKMQIRSEWTNFTTARKFCQYNSAIFSKKLLFISN